MKIFLFSIAIIISLVCCKNDNAATPQATKPAPTEEVNAGPQFQQLPNDILLELWNNGTLIDYIFHELPFSMNQSEQASIRTNLTYFSSEAQANIPTECKPLGRQMFSIDGNIVLESDIYYSDNCAFFVFIMDGETKYANKMSDAGKQFYATMIQKGLEAGKQRQG